MALSVTKKWILLFTAVCSLINVGFKPIDTKCSIEFSPEFTTCASKAENLDPINKSSCDKDVEDVFDIDLLSSAMTSMCDVLISDDFESGFGNWVDGGNDCVRSTNANRSASGISSIRLRDDTNTSVMTSGPYDLSSINQVEVVFSFLTIGFEVNEDFWLQISEDGSNYTTVQAWSRTIDFENNERHNPLVSLTGPFSSTTYFRFRADGSDNTDLVFIDDVEISMCSDIDLLFTTTSVNPVTTYAGGSVSGSYNVRNDGSGTAGPSTLGVFLSSDAEFDVDSDILLYLSLIHISEPTRPY